MVGYGSNDRTKTTKVEVEKIFVRPEFLEKGLNGQGRCRADQAQGADRRS